MNRYLLGGALGAVVLLVVSGGWGLSQLWSEPPPAQNEVEPNGSSTPTESTGASPSPIQEGGATEPTPPTPNSPDNRPNSPTEGLTDAPADPNGVPDAPNSLGQGPETTLPAQVGDIAPVQPDLVRPEPQPPVTDDSDLESIPALW